MLTVKIKIEPTAATAAVDVQVKLEPSLSTGDIKLEQHTSDIDTKVESDSEDDSDIKSEDDDDSDESDDQDQFTITPKKQIRFICEYSGCGRRFNSSRNLKRHQHDHRLRAEINMLGKTYIVTRQSLNDRWPCPIPDCEVTPKTADAVRGHIRKVHNNTLRQQQQHQQSPTKNTRHNLYFYDVDNFYVNDIHCGYHTTIGVFICYACKLVPECLSTHLQQTHGYDEKSIDSPALPESAVNASTDSNINQHTSNPHLASAISQSSQLQHPGIVQGWLCVTSNCGIFGYTSRSKNDHKKKMHQSEHLTTVLALILRLNLTRIQTSYFLITRIDQVASSSNRVNRHKLDYSYNGLNIHDENGDDTSQNETTDESNQKQQWKCEYPNCGRLFNSSNQISAHLPEHKLEVVIKVQGMNITLSRQSLDDRWPCPVPECETVCITISGIRVHIQKVHSTSLKHKRTSVKHDNNHQQLQQGTKRSRPAIRHVNVDVFYVGDIRYGYHTTTGLFICRECRLVPECLLTHLQRKHGFDDKSIDDVCIPESATNASADPNGNQHTSNSYLAPVISQSSQLHHQDIVKGWFCVTSDCGYCGYTADSKSDHKKAMHKGEQLLTVPALVLRLLYGKSKTTCFLITRLDTIANNTVERSYSISQQINEVDDDDGDELVLSDYSDEDNIY